MKTIIKKGTNISRMTARVKSLEKQLNDCLEQTKSKPDRKRPEVFEALQKVGIVPSQFAFFLVEFQKQTGKGKLSRLLTDQLKAQAELILLHINS